MPYKLYPEVSGLALPRDLSLARVPALEAIAASDAPGGSDELSLEALTRILFCADGLTRRARVGGEDYHFRAAPSAGALYPIEIYAAVATVGELEQGLYHFSPADLRLRGLRRGDWRGLIARAAAGRPSLLEARAVIVLSAIFWRSAWKYRARAYRYCFWDAGTMLANLLAAAAAEGLSTEARHRLRRSGNRDTARYRRRARGRAMPGRARRRRYRAGRRAGAAAARILETIPALARGGRLSGPGADASGVPPAHSRREWPKSPTRKSIRCRRRRRAWAVKPELP